MNLKAFLKGMASISIFPSHQPKIKTDLESLTEDWEKVGNDMRIAMGKMEILAMPFRNALRYQTRWFVWTLNGTQGFGSPKCHQCLSWEQFTLSGTRISVP